MKRVAVVTVLLMVALLAVGRRTQGGGEEHVMTVDTTEVMDETFGMVSGAEVVTNLQEHTHTPVQLVRDVPAATGICAGGYFSLALASDGGVLTWGLLPPGIMRAPARVAGLPERAMAVACGGYHAAVLGDSGRVFTWGKNQHGALGHGDALPLDAADAVPRPVAALTTKRIVAVCAGYAHTAALTDAGEVYLWGAADSGQVGVISQDAVATPRLLASPDGRPVLAEGVFCGGRHTAVVPRGSNYSRLLMFGSVDFGALGVGDADVSGATAEPREVLLPGDCGRVESVSCGGDHSFVVCSGGRAFGFGWNGHGQLCLGDTTDRTSPTALPEQERKLQALVAGAYSSSLAVWEDGAISACGAAEYGALDSSTIPPGFSPTPQTLLADVPFTGITNGEVAMASVGYKHALFLLRDGRLAAMGDDTFGQLGTLPPTGSSSSSSSS